jgi:glycosyl transferase, family 25
VQIFVINLKTRKDRRDNVMAQLSGAGVPFKFFSAVEGTGQLHNYFTGSNPLQFLLETGHFPEPAEINCYASHLTLWKQCVVLAQPIVIMEDDFQITTDFLRILARTETLIARCGFIRLEALEERWQHKPGLAPALVRSDEGINLYCQRMPSVRATCYALTPACAAAFIAASTTLAAPVDHVIRRCWRHGQLLYALTPPAIRLSEYAEQSSIRGRQKHPARHLAGALRPLYRLTERWRARRFMANKLQYQSLPEQ